MRAIIRTEQDRQDFIQRLLDLDLAKTWIAEFRQKRKLRTLSQNAYLHVCISLYAVHFGLTLAEAKYDLKFLCDFMAYEKNNKKYYRETSKMNTADLTSFIEWIRNYAGMNGCYIPDAETYKLERDYFDKQIENCKEFL